MKFKKYVLYTLVFYCGFANLATEIIGPRLVSSIFGNTTTIWAIIISVTLVGISIGYTAGGRIPRQYADLVLPLALTANTIWFLIISWIVMKTPLLFTRPGGVASIVFTSLCAFLVPSLIFGIISPLSITLLSKDKTPQQISRIVGNIYGLGTAGSVLGSLAAAFLLIPWVGLNASLRLFALLMAVFSHYFLSEKLRLLTPIVLLICVLFPSPVYGLDNDLILVADAEGYYQTIRIYTDGENFIRMNLGSWYDSAEMDLNTLEPRLDYAVTMVELAGNVSGKRVLIIGGAGHTQARALEKRGATIVEVEIDPIVVRYSDQYFGPIQGEITTQDGRAYLEHADGEIFDHILVDAYGLNTIPTHLTTLEFFQAAQRRLKSEGKLIYNLIGVPVGPRSNSFHALSETMATVFQDVRASRINGFQSVNIILVASDTEMDDLNYSKAPRYGRLLTDELNPVEIYFEQALQ